MRWPRKGIEGLLKNLFINAIATTAGEKAGIVHVPSVRVAVDRRVDCPTDFPSNQTAIRFIHLFNSPTKSVFQFIFDWNLIRGRKDGYSQLL